MSNLLYYGFFARRPYSWNRQVLSEPGLNGDNLWDTGFTNRNLDVNPTNGVFSMGMETTLNLALPFTSAGSNRNDNIFTSAISLRALAGDDLVYGTTRSQQLFGNEGHDTINGAGGADTIDGGAGINQVSFGIAGAGTPGGTINPYGIGVNVNLLAGTFTYTTTSDARGICVFAGATGRVLNVRQVWGGTGADTIVAENSGDTIWGNERADIITGGSGGDLLLGDGNAAAITDGNDTIRAGVRNDSIIGGLGADIINGGAGNNFIYGDYTAVAPGLLSDGADRIDAANGQNTVYGGGASDRIILGTGANLVYGDYAVATAQDSTDTITAGTGGTGNNTISGGGRDDVIAAGNGNNLIYGDHGASNTATDTIPSQDGSDTITAGNGDSTIYGGGRGDLINAGNGRNLIFGDYGTKRVPRPTVTLTGNEYGYALNLGDGNDTITAGNGGNTVYGGGANDWVVTGAGADLIFGDNYYPRDSSQYPYSNAHAPDSASESLAGNDSIFTGAGDDVVFAGAGHDLVSGGSGSDLLVGNGGNDSIFSGSGGPYSLVAALSVGDRVYVGGGAPGLPGAPGFVAGARFSVASPDPASGVNEVWVGYDVDRTSLRPVTIPGALGTAVLADFNPVSSGQPLGTDTLHVAAGAVAIIGGVNSVMNWEGADVLDLRTAAADNLGLIVASTGARNDTVQAGKGNYRIYGNDGLNTIELQSTTTADIYIDTFASRALVIGATSDDRILVNKALVDAFRTSSTFRQGLLSTATVDATGVAVGDGQALNSGLVGMLTFSATYNNYLARASVLPIVGSQVPQNPGGGFNPQPYPSLSVPGSNVLPSASTPTPADYTVWNSGGAYPNTVYRYAAGFGTVADYAAGSALIAVGYVLMGIPFVGLIIGGASIVLGALHINDAVNNIQPHLNATYQTSASLTSNYASLWNGDAQRYVGDNTSWDGASFLSLYEPAYDGAVPALEVTAADLSSNVQNTYGIHAIVAVNSKTASGSDKTYIYLVNSADNMVLNSEALLLAQVDYRLSASQVVIYDGATDPYNQPGAVAPVLAPSVTSVTLGGGGAAGNATAGGYVTTSADPSLTATFFAALTNTDTVRLYNGSTLLATLSRGNGTGLTFDPSASTATFASVPGFTTNAAAYSVVATSTQGFQSEWTGQFVYDANSPALAPALEILHSTNAMSTATPSAPLAYAAGLRPTGSFLKVISNTAGSAGLMADTSVANVGLTKFGSVYEGVLMDLAAYAQSGSAIQSGIFATDSLGLRQEITAYPGITGAPTVLIGPTGSGSTIQGGTTDIAVYSIGMADTVYAGPAASFVVVDDSRTATAQVSIGTGLQIGSVDSVLIGGVSYRISSYNTASGYATVLAIKAGDRGNASNANPASLNITLQQRVIVVTAGVPGEVVTSTVVGSQSVGFTGGSSGATKAYGEAAGQILYGGGGYGELHAATAAGAGGISLVAGASGQLLRSYGNADYLFDSVDGNTTLIGGGGADTIDVSHGTNTVRFLHTSDAVGNAHPLIVGFSATDGTIFDLLPALVGALDDPSTIANEYLLDPVDFVAAMLDLSTGTAQLGAGEVGYAQHGGNTFVLVNASGGTVTGLSSSDLVTAPGSRLEMVFKIEGTHTLAAADFRL